MVGARHVIWRPISPATLQAARAEADTARANWKGVDHVWNPERFLIGSLAERLVASRLGLERADLGRGPDGGADFGDVDVKGIEPDSRFLMRLEERHHWATWYAVVLVDLAGERAAIAGHTHVSELRASQVRDFGHGPTLCLPLSELEPGLPPHMLLRLAGRDRGKARA